MLVDTEKALIKVQHPFRIKSLTIWKEKGASSA